MNSEPLDLDPELFGTGLQGRYDDPRRIKITPACNYEVMIYVGDEEPICLDALDLLRAVSHVVLDLVYGPSPTEGGPHDH